MAIINAVTIEQPVATQTDINNRAAFQVQTVTVTTAGTPVQGPSIAVPYTVAVAIQNDPANGNNDEVYIANSSANALLPASRIMLRRGQSISLFITNTDLLWFDSNVNGVDVKLLVEA